MFYLRHNFYQVLVKAVCWWIEMFGQHRIYQSFANIFIFHQHSNKFSIECCKNKAGRSRCGHLTWYEWTLNISHGLEHEADSDPHTNFFCTIVNLIWIIQIVDSKTSGTGLGKDSDTRVRPILVFNITLTQSISLSQKISE